MRRFVARHSPLFILAGLCLILAIVSEDFRQPRNLQKVAYRTSVVGIMATGQILVILTAGIDLSVGSIAALAGVVACVSMKKLGVPAAGEGAELIISGFDVCAGVAIGALVGLLGGAINGFLVTKGKIPPFIVTLGMMMVARGIALLVSGAVSVSGLPESFKYLGGSRGWYIPVGITAAIAAVFAVTLAFTRFGRAVYATGGKLTAARLSGIAVDRVRFLCYSLCGLLCGFAGVVLASRTAIAQPTGAESYELDAIAACVIGGASLMGGEGGCVGALAGALIMQVLLNFCNLRGFDVYWQKVLIGALIIILVYYDNFRKRRAGLLHEA
ncbi:MAG TPA: ABC transporter permease [Candidatus Hydrogenedentes bacterium]|nr:ABC transporter permease [Candidatus Hydrogenedentota bacterium]HPG67530.1 ABC transporter permease [Candidatus Hydrogenedentota bacterium]